MTRIDGFGTIDGLLAEACELNDSPAKIALLEQAVRLADSQNSIEESIEIRFTLMDAAAFGGASEKLIVAFSWVLATFDRDPELVDVARLLWKYKWVLGHAPDFPEISKTRLLGLCQDFKNRLLQHGYGLSSYYRYLDSIYTCLGDTKNATKYFKKWFNSERDDNSNCQACDLNAKVSQLIDLEQTEKALKLASPILNREMTCGSLPHAAYTNFLFPLAKAGKTELADQFSRLGYRLTTGKHDFLDDNATHLSFMTYRNELKRAANCFEKHLPMAISSGNPSNRLEFFAACFSFLEWLVGHNLKRAATLRVPKSIDVVADDGSLEPHELLAWFGEQVTELSSRFDKRNGNTHISSAIAERHDLVVNSG